MYVLLSYINVLFLIIFIMYKIFIIYVSDSFYYNIQEYTVRISIQTIQSIPMELLIES